MKIDDVSVTLFTWVGLPDVHYGRNIKMGGTSTLGLVEIRTDGGLVGHAFIGGAIRGVEVDAQRLIATLKPILMGQNPLDREKLGERLWGAARLASVRAIGAVDVALWDIAGKAAGLPIHQLIGTYRESLPAYASSPAYESAEIYIDEAQSYKARGVGAYKLHAPSPWKQDIAVCTAVRKALGDEHVLMLDSTWSYDYPEALRVGLALDELGFHWFEDPLSDHDIYNYTKLKSKLVTPILATELPFAGLEQYSPWIMAQATDFLRGDVAFKGGITTMLKTAHLAEAFHMNYEIHHGSNSLNNWANLHVAMAIRNCEYFEVLLPDAANKYGLVEDIEIDAAGLVHAPTEPGLGAKIDFELIRRHQEAVLR